MPINNKALYLSRDDELDKNLFRLSIPYFAASSNFINNSNGIYNIFGPYDNLSSNVKDVFRAIFYKCHQYREEPTIEILKLAAIREITIIDDKLEDNPELTKDEFIELWNFLNEIDYPKEEYSEYLYTYLFQNRSDKEFIKKTFFLHRRADLYIDVDYNYILHEIDLYCYILGIDENLSLYQKYKLSCRDHPDAIYLQALILNYVYFTSCDDLGLAMYKESIKEFPQPELSLIPLDEELKIYVNKNRPEFLEKKNQEIINMLKNNYENGHAESGFLYAQKLTPQSQLYTNILLDNWKKNRHVVSYEYYLKQEPIKEMPMCNIMDRRKLLWNTYKFTQSLMNIINSLNNHKIAYATNKIIYERYAKLNIKCMIDSFLSKTCDGKGCNPNPEFAIHQWRIMMTKNNSDYFDILANYYVKHGNSIEAIRICEEALKNNSSRANIILYARVLRKMDEVGFYNKIIDLYLMGWKTFETPNFLSLYAGMLIKRGEFERARLFYKVLVYTLNFKISIEPYINMLKRGIGGPVDLDEANKLENNA